MRLLAVVVLLCATSTFAADAVPDMKETVNSFYTVYLSIHSSGVPTEKEFQKLKPYISASLAKLLVQAGRAEQRYRKTTKGEVPPLAEGDLFTSLFEGATAHQVLSCDAMMSACMMKFCYSGNSSSPVVWNDRVYLTEEPKGWRIDDVEFLGTWEFMHKGRLRDVLKDVITKSGKK
jgi:hypothetical protein